jgi:hypothetical protein
MADTVEIALNDSTWVEVGSDGTSGYVTSKAVVKLLYRESASLPADEVGHVLEMNTGSFFNYALTAGQKVYMKSLHEPAIITMTAVTVV